MADQRDGGISWTDKTWNPVVGCSIVSPACTNCYAMAAAHGIQAKNAGSRRKAMETGGKVPAETHYAGTTRVVNGKPVWTGKLALAPDHILTAPLRWRGRHRVFVNSMSDLFHEDMPEDWIDEVFAVMALSPQHTFQILTKRPERMRAYLTKDWAAAARRHVEDLTLPTFSRATADTQDRLRRYTSPGFPHPLENVWLGVTAEDRARADERIPLLLSTPAAVRFVSAEPLLGPIQLAEIRPDLTMMINALTGVGRHLLGYAGQVAGLDWVIAGGESGPGARPTHPDWVRSIRDQCAEAGVAFHFKQWGCWAPNETGHPITGQPTSGRSHGQFVSHTFADGVLMNRTTVTMAGRTLDGQIHDAFPEAP